MNSSKLFLHTIETQMLLHDIHIHLTVTEDDCPICKEIPLEDMIAMVCTDIPLDLLEPINDPHLMVVVDT